MGHLGFAGAGDAPSASAGAPTPASLASIKSSMTATQLEGALKGIESPAMMSKADKLDELRDDFPTADSATLERALDAAKGDLAAARKALEAKKGGMTEMM